jgi:hypothetical protein
MLQTHKPLGRRLSSAWRAPLHSHQSENTSPFLREGFHLQVREANGVERSQLGCIKAFYFLSRHCCVTGFAPAAVLHLMLVYAGQVSDIVDVYHIATGTWSTAQLSKARASHEDKSPSHLTQKRRLPRCRRHVQRCDRIMVNSHTEH